MMIGIMEIDEEPEETYDDDEGLPIAQVPITWEEFDKKLIRTDHLRTRYQPTPEEQKEIAKALKDKELKEFLGSKP